MNDKKKGKGDPVSADSLKKRVDHGEVIRPLSLLIMREEPNLARKREKKRAQTRRKKAEANRGKTSPGRGSS